MYFPYSSFEHAALDVLQHLRHNLGFAFWAISRSEEDELELVAAIDSHYGVAKGTRVKWTDSICCRMVDGLGPKIVPDLDQVPAYKNAPLAQRFAISAYIGFPLWDSDGQLFGTLAAMDPAPQPAELTRSESTLQLFSRLVSTHLSLDLQIRSQANAINSTSRLEEIIDSETKLLNYAGWSRLLQAQQRRGTSIGLQSYTASIWFEFNTVATILAALEPIRKVLGPQAVLARGKYNEVLVCIADLAKEQGDRVMGKLSEELSKCLNTKFEIRSSTSSKRLAASSIHLSELVVD